MREITEEEKKDVEEYEQEQFIARRSFEIGTRKTPLSNHVLAMLGDILQPQTTGLDQVNMDMSFSWLDRFDIEEVKSLSHIITFCEIHGLKKSNYLARSDLATLLNAKRSQNGHSFSLFNTTITKSSSEMEDKTEKKTGFGFPFSFGGKKK